MKIATFNINNVNKRLANLTDWLAEAQPDVVCLQELKAAHHAFPATALEAAGYGAVWQGQPTWNGVAILARGAEPVVTRRALPGDPADTQARYIEAAVNGVLVGCVYLPNGNPQPGPKFAYKLAWFERLIAHAAALQASGLPVVLAGDYNVVPTDADIYPSKSWGKDALLQPESRAAFARLLAQGWTDALRTRHPTGPLYTFWDYKRARWARSAGLRIDHILLSTSLCEQLTDAGVEKDVRGQRGRQRSCAGLGGLGRPGSEAPAQNAQHGADHELTTRSAFLQFCRGRLRACRFASRSRRIMPDPALQSRGQNVHPVSAAPQVAVVQMPGRLTMPIVIRELHIKVNVNEPSATTQTEVADLDAYVLTVGDDAALRQLQSAQHEAFLAYEASEAEAAGIVVVGGWGSSAYQYG